LLQILVYRPKRSHLYWLLVIQGLVYAFSVFDWGFFAFYPLVEKFSPSLLRSIVFLNPADNPLAWAIRGVLGLIVSLSLIGFLIILRRNSIREQQVSAKVVDSTT